MRFSRERERSNDARAGGKGFCDKGIEGRLRNVERKKSNETGAWRHCNTIRGPDDLHFYLEAIERHHRDYGHARTPLDPLACSFWFPNRGCNIYRNIKNRVLHLLPLIRIVSKLLGHLCTQLLKIRGRSGLESCCLVPKFI